MIKDKNQSSVRSLNFWQIKLKNDISFPDWHIFSWTPSMYHHRPPVNINHLTLSSLALPFISHAQNQIHQSLPRIPDYSTSTPLHRQPPRSANSSILIFQLLPPLWLQVCFFPEVQKWLQSPEWDDVIKFLYHGLALTLNWKPSGKGRCRRMERRRQAQLHCPHLICHKYQHFTPPTKPPFT